jgi:ABC-type multidrug transport system ATPase subunit
LTSRVRVIVLSDISFQCKPNEPILLTGRNGSGKSTLLRIIAGIMKPSKGEIIIKGKIGYYPQNPTFNKGVNVLDFVNYIGKLKNNSYKKEEGIYWLNKFGISEKWYYIDILLLSEGMKRRVALGLAFICNPEILLLDEPLENLDSKTKENFLEYIRLVKKEKTIIIATHDIKSFMEFDCRIINIEKGTIT